MDQQSTLPRIEPTAKDRGGVWVPIGLAQYRVPALSLRSVADLQSAVQSLSNMRGLPTSEQLATIEQIVHASLRRNYSELTVEEVGEMLDIGNMNAVLDAVLSVSGFVRGPAEGTASGETKASTGTSSTSASSTPSDGRGNT